MSTPASPDLPDLTSQEMADAMAVFASEGKAIDLVELHVRELVGYTDFFLVATGNTERQVKAIHDRVYRGMKDAHRMLPRRVEGLGESRWVLLDYFDVVVHIFTPEAREFYRLEQLWGEVPKRAVGTPAASEPAASEPAAPELA